MISQPLPTQQFSTEQFAQALNKTPEQLIDLIMETNQHAMEMQIQSPITVLPDGTFKVRGSFMEAWAGLVLRSQ